jgi:PKD repeat protein
VLNQNQGVTVGVAPGTYTLTLVDTNNYTAVKVIQVNGPEMVSAAFNASGTVVETQQPITLIASTTNAATYQWNFGNGTTATGADAAVAYTQPGVYTINLTVTSQSGCSSATTKTITVNGATGITNVTGTGNLNIWSHDNKVYVDFTQIQNVDATVILYNILGQEISNEKVTSNRVYQREVDNIDAAYLIVMVREGDKITTKKVFLDNGK